MVTRSQVLRFRTPVCFPHRGAAGARWKSAWEERRGEERQQVWGIPRGKRHRPWVGVQQKRGATGVGWDRAPLRSRSCLKQPTSNCWSTDKIFRWRHTWTTKQHLFSSHLSLQNVGFPVPLLFHAVEISRFFFHWNNVVWKGFRVAVNSSFLGHFPSFPKVTAVRTDFLKHFLQSFLVFCFFSCSSRWCN